MLTGRRKGGVATPSIRNGALRYVLTDNVTMSKTATAAARKLIRAGFGAGYLPRRPRVFPPYQPHTLPNTGNRNMADLASCSCPELKHCRRLCVGYREGLTTRSCHEGHLAQRRALPLAV